MTETLTFDLVQQGSPVLEILGHVRIHQDGRVELLPGFDKDEAAKIFWEHLAHFGGRISASEIASKDREIAALKEALAPFAKFYDALGEDDEFSEGVLIAESNIFRTIEKEDLRRARSAHEGKT